ncbi:zinc-ribbon domain-containing protein [Candidatus Uabimicrobium amorphum]|uniref:Zinc-ribbon domain-containing protein n=1 Tax=Uabimicrobium amorphum TaxID=2596890 RepID=A0A5S9F1L0_UABAM|nr:zinc ribbon domain-containing protein [Candidatus Uabimicrobium amorphum]BBM82173.1 hypothetical protein UABAM_00516 [Candidatus Uabimicrobium amorphum]
MPNTKICNSCGQQINAEHVFCIHCGANLEKQNSSPTDHSPLQGDKNSDKTTVENKSNNLNALLVIILTVIVISLTLRIPIQRVILFFIPVAVVWVVHSLLKKIEGS